MAQLTRRDVAKRLHTSKLLRCVSRGTLRDLRSVMRGRADLDIVDDNGIPLFHYAAVNPNTNVLEYLLAAGLSVETKDKKGRTPVLMWAREGTLNNLQVLIARGANIHARDDQGSTVLHYAALQANPAEMISYMIGKGVNIDEKNNLGETAFHCSSLVGNLPAMMSLVHEGTNILEPTIGGANALHLAVLNPSSRAIKYLLSLGIDMHIDSKDDEGMTPLHFCARKGTGEILMLLLNRGAFIDARCNNGATPLIYCAAEGTVQNLRILLEWGANVQAQDIEGRTAIHDAFTNPHLAAIIEYLLKKGLSIETRDNLQRTPLHFYAQYGTLEGVKILIENGANINARSTKGLTTLHLAAGNETTTEIMKYFLEKGLLIEERDEGGLTALHHSIYSANVRNMKFLIQKGADVYARDQQNATTLHMAAGHGDTTEALEYLLEKGVPIDARDTNGKTPLLACATRGNLKKMKFLVDRGADISARDNEGVSALHLAAVNSEETDIMQYLLDLGISLEVRDNCGITPLHASAAHGNLQNVKFLCEKGADPKSLPGCQGITVSYEQEQ